MSFFFNNHEPYTDFHELNLDWIISRLGELKKAITEAAASAAAALAAEQGAKESADSAADSAETATDAATAAQGYADSINPELIQQDIADGVQEAKDYTDDAIDDLQAELDTESDFKLDIGMSKFATLRPAVTTDFGAFIQGACVVGPYIFACDTGENRILRYDTVTETTTVVAYFEKDDYGHMNDACYDGSYIYVAPAPGVTGKIYRFAVNEINGSLGSATELTVPENLEIWNIAYDADTELFYTITYYLDHADIVKFSITGSTITIEDTVTGTGIYNYWPDSPRQGIEYADGYIYCLAGSGNLPLDASVTVFDLEGHYVCKMMLPLTLGEPESLCYDRVNKLMLMGTNLWGYTNGYPRESVFFVLDYKSKYSDDEVTGLYKFSPVGYNAADPYATTMINTSRYEGYAAPDTIVRAARTWYGTTCKVKLNPTGHFLVLINHTRIYLGWFAGSPVQVNFTSIAGDGVTATASLSGNELTITASQNAAITVLYFNGYRM